MTSSYDFIATVNADKESWKLLCRVIRLWGIPSFKDVNIPYALEIVLMDEKGDKIQASIQHSVLGRFKDVFQEGQVYAISNVGVGTNSGTYRNTKHNYKLIFEKYTSVRLIATPTMIPMNGYSFTSYSQLNSPDFDRKYLIDVMGLLCGIGVERIFEKDGKKTKYNVIQLDMDGFRIECALFGNYVDQLDTFIRGGEKPNTVVVLQYVSVRTFKGKTALQNSMYSTKILFNPDIPEVVEYISTLSSDNEVCTQTMFQLIDNQISIEEDFLYHNPAMTVEQLKNCQEDSVCVVVAKIDHIIDNQDWWYNACRCNKSTEFVSRMFYCDYCNRYFLTPSYRFKIKICVIDETGSTTFVIFDRDAFYLLKQTCADMLDRLEKKKALTDTPRELFGLVDKCLLFKVDVKNNSIMKYDQTYRVKRVCDDTAIIEKFKAMQRSAMGCKLISPSVGDIMSQDATGEIQGSSSKNLLPSFDDCISDKPSDSVSNAPDIGDIELIQVTPAKRHIEELNPSNNDSNSITQSVKTIKQEKK